MLICQRRRTNEGFHKWSASENEKLHYALMKFLSSSSSILKGARHYFPFAWCAATGTHAYLPEPSWALSRKKTHKPQGACVWVKWRSWPRSGTVIKASAQLRDALQFHTDLRLCLTVTFVLQHSSEEQWALKEHHNLFYRFFYSVLVPFIGWRDRLWECIRLHYWLL